MEGVKLKTLILKEVGKVTFYGEASILQRFIFTFFSGGGGGGGGLLGKYVHFWILLLLLLLLFVFFFLQK